MVALEAFDSSVVVGNGYFAAVGYLISNLQ